MLDAVFGYEVTMLPQCPAGIPVYLWAVVAEQPHQRRDAAELPSLGLDRVVHVTEVLEIGRSISLYHGVWILKEFDDLVEIWVSPLYARHCIYT